MHNCIRFFFYQLFFFLSRNTTKVDKKKKTDFDFAWSLSSRLPITFFLNNFKYYVIPDFKFLQNFTMYATNTVVCSLVINVSTSGAVDFNFNSS